MSETHPAETHLTVDLSNHSIEEMQFFADGRGLTLEQWIAAAIHHKIIHERGCVAIDEFFRDHPEQKAEVDALRAERAKQPSQEEELHPALVGVDLSEPLPAEFFNPDKLTQ